MKPGHLYSISLILTLLVSNSAIASDITIGRDIYQRHCAMCHGAAGVPTMAGATDFKSGQGLMKSDQALLERIKAGDKACPAYRGILREQEILDVIAYIRTMF